MKVYYKYGIHVNEDNNSQTFEGTTSVKTENSTELEPESLIYSEISNGEWIASITKWSKKSKIYQDYDSNKKPLLDTHVTTKQPYFFEDWDDLNNEWKVSNKKLKFINQFYVNKIITTLLEKINYQLFHSNDINFINYTEKKRDEIQDKEAREFLNDDDKLKLKHLNNKLDLKAKLLDKLHIIDISLHNFIKDNNTDTLKVVEYILKYACTNDIMDYGSKYYFYNSYSENGKDVGNTYANQLDNIEGFFNNIIITIGNYSDSNLITKYLKKHNMLEKEVISYKASNINIEIDRDESGEYSHNYQGDFKNEHTNLRLEENRRMEQQNAYEDNQYVDYSEGSSNAHEEDYEDNQYVDYSEGSLNAHEEAYVANQNIDYTNYGQEPIGTPPANPSNPTTPEQAV